MKISMTTPNIYASINKNNSNSQYKPYTSNGITFGAAIKPESKFFAPIIKLYRHIMNPIEEKLADGFQWLVQTKVAEKIVTETGNHPKFKEKLFPHLIVLGSTILSGFYVLKTLNNKKLDEKKRTTLAINQGAVYVLSTIMAYTFDIALGKKTTAVKKEFERINAGKLNVNKQLNGIGKAKSIIIIDSIYRFLAPVAMTPIANAIGNRIQNKKNEELVFGNNGKK